MEYQPQAMQSASSELTGSIRGLDNDSSIGNCCHDAVSLREVCFEGPFPDSKGRHKEMMLIDVLLQTCVLCRVCAINWSAYDSDRRAARLNGTRKSFCIDTSR